MVDKRTLSAGLGRLLLPGDGELSAIVVGKVKDCDVTLAFRADAKVFYEVLSSVAVAVKVAGDLDTLLQRGQGDGQEGKLESITLPSEIPIPIKVDIVPATGGGDDEPGKEQQE